MRQRHALESIALTTVMSVCTFFAMHAPGVCQEKPTEAKAAKTTRSRARDAVSEKAKTSAKKAKAPRGRLPAYYRKVVDREQREDIYAVQREYAARIDDLKAKLAALVKERDAKIAAVLTPQQQDKVRQLREEAKAKRAAKKKKK